MATATQETNTMPATTTIPCPGRKAYAAWWTSLDHDVEYTCNTCGKAGPIHYVQPIHPYYAGGHADVVRCTDCHNQAVEDSRAARKQQLAEAPRCEVDGCTHRGTWNVGAGKVLLCGSHKRRAERNAPAVSMLFAAAASVDYGREATLRYATA